MDNRQVALNELLQLATSQGYVTFDDIMDCADKRSLPIQDFEWLSNAITVRGVTVYSEKPSQELSLSETEYDNFTKNACTQHKQKLSNTHDDFSSIMQKNYSDFLNNTTTYTGFNDKAGASRHSSEYDKIKHSQGQYKSDTEYHNFIKSTFTHHKQKLSNPQDNFSSIIQNDYSAFPSNATMRADFTDKTGESQIIDFRQSLDDEVNHLTIIKDFDQYKHCFALVHQQLQHGSIKLQKIIGNNDKIEFGSVFIINSMLNIIIDASGNTVEGTKLYRVFQIFENGNGGWFTTQAVRASFYRKKDSHTCYRIVPANDEGITFLNDLRHELERMRSNHTMIY